MGWRADGKSISAGQIDALYIDSDGLYYLFDFKRVAKNHKLCPKEKGFTPGRGTPPACGLGPMAHLPDTHFQKYSLQTSIYNLMLKDLHGIDVGDRMYLLRVHSDRSAFEQVQCRDLRSEALTALNSERERLAAQPQPAPSPAAPAAPAAPQGPSGATPPQGSAEVRRRPPGRAPAGKVWLDGAFVDRPTAKRARSPTTEITLKVRPMGKAPKGKTWDGVAGCWKDTGNTGCFKRKALAPTVDPNSLPKPRQRPRRR